jgi:hypothetical protein
MKLFFIVLLCLLSCASIESQSNEESIEYFFENDRLEQKVVVKSVDSLSIDFFLVTKDKLNGVSCELSGRAKLPLLEDNGVYYTPDPGIYEDVETNQFFLAKEYVYQVGMYHFNIAIDTDNQTKLYVNMFSSDTNSSCEFEFNSFLSRR